MRAFRQWRSKPYSASVARLPDSSSSLLPSSSEAVPLVRGSELYSGPALLYAAAKGAYVLHMLRMRIGDDATKASHRIVYDDDSGAVYFDSDGVGGDPQVQFADVGKHLDLTHKDFLLQLFA